MLSQIKIIIVTSMPEHSFIQKARAAGCESFLHKDISKEELIKVMDRTMAGESWAKNITPAVYEDVSWGWISSPEFTVMASAPTVPDAPTNVSAVAGNGQTAITFTAPANNGAATITGYTVTSNPGSITATGTGSPITVTRLPNGTTYTFTVRATNSVGDSTASAASNSVTPK
ncbi:MAG: fibronectin type III domain-containing protein [Syntrophomonas sp.]